MLSVLLTALLGASSSTLSVLRHSEGAVTARMAAESLLAKATLELRSREDYGIAGESMSFLPEKSDSGTAVLTFDASRAEQLGIPVSVNNLSNSESRPGPHGEVVPARTARLYAMGRYEQESRIVVLDLHIPPYPYAVATEGTFASMGDLTLSGISPDTGDEIPGHLVANSDLATSVVLGPRSIISGDLVSAGGINLNGDGIEVKGQVRPFEEPAPVPSIPLESLDPRLLAAGGDPANLDTSFYRDARMEGKILRDGDLMLGGDTVLDGALLYVDGNLQVSGTLAGRGAIVCTGDVSIDGTQSLAADNEMALLAGGSLSLSGRGVDSSRLEGLIYCEGDVLVRDSTIQGTLISKANGSTIPQVIMERVNLVEDPSHAHFSIDVSGQPEPQYFLAFREDGHHDPKSSGEDPTDPGHSGKGKSVIFMGLAAKPDGSFLVFPPGGANPVSASGTDTLVDAISTELGKLYGQKAAKHIEGCGELKRLRSEAEALQLAVSQAPAGAATGDLELNIDPMRFLKYGERIKVRSIRVLPSGKAGTHAF